MDLACEKLPSLCQILLAVRGFVRRTQQFDNGNNLPRAPILNFKKSVAFDIYLYFPRLNYS
jgi:hypothetical protein